MPAISNNDFADAMAALGPFEAAPELAVAVSGGADSMALTLLAQAWARQRGGGVTALTVDHGLRAAAAREARQVHAWLTDKGIPHHTLRWRGDKPHGGIQAAARQARYGLLRQYCRRRGILHLLTAHHGDDQAETLALRLEHGSGIEGLAGIPGIRALDGVRLLRPLLRRRHADLVRTLGVYEQSWLEDPSNQDEAFARVRARRHLANDEHKTLSLLGLGREAARTRRQLRGALADLAARSVRLHPAGFCRFDPGPSLGLDGLDLDGLGQHSALLAPLLGDILRCVGGGSYRPRRERLDRLAGDVAHQRLVAGRTLAGCRILPTAEGLLICRETGRLPGREKTGGRKSGRWDRFDWRLKGEMNTRRSGNFAVGALGPDGWRQLRGRAPTILPGAPPSPVRLGLPALWLGDKILAVPHLNLAPDADAPQWTRKISFSARFLPLRPLQAEGLVLV